LSRDRQIIRRRFLRFLYEGVQRDQHASVESKQDARLTPASKCGTHFPQTAAQWPTYGQANRPSELHLGDIAANRPLIIARQFV
jgi:hypothetical protein